MRGTLVYDNPLSPNSLRDQHVYICNMSKVFYYLCNTNVLSKTFQVLVIVPYFLSRIPAHT